MKMNKWILCRTSSILTMPLTLSFCLFTGAISEMIVSAQTLAPLKVLAMPKPANPLHDKVCPNFLKTDISGTDRVDFRYEGATETVDVRLENITVIIGDNNIPTARPVAGRTDRPGPWELVMSQATYNENSACLPAPQKSSK